MTSDHGITTTHAPMNTAASSDHEWMSVSRMRLPSTKYPVKTSRLRKA